MGGGKREILRRFHVLSRLARAAAFHFAYRAYAWAIACARQSPPSKQAALALRRRLEQLFDEDWRDAEAGYYPRALIGRLPWREYASVVPRLFIDVPRRRRRIRRENFFDLPDAAQPQRYPEYYARNFHFQTDGYLGDTSAALYDLQVELLFAGTADAMRRRMIRPVVRFARSQPPPRRPLRMLDVACGTGHLLEMMSAALGDAVTLCGLDLSPHYLARARKILPRKLEVSLVCDNAERLPFPDGHFDVVTNAFLLHEVPREVRGRVIAEMARVLRPGGLLVVADSIQLADAPELREQILDFPVRYHEPYYLDYLNDDLPRRLRAAGLRVLEERSSFVTRVVTAERLQQ